MDAFFVSVELVRRPELRGKPVVVATGTDAGARGVVMAASYEARRYGVHSALPLAVAHRRCPQATLIPRDIGLYRRASSKVMEVLRRFSDRVEVAGLDEAYLDLSDCPAPKARARQLKAEVRDRDAPGLLGGPGAQQAAREDRLRPRKARRTLRARAGADARRGRRAPRDPDPRRRAANGPAARAARGPDRGRARERRSGDAGPGLRTAARPRASRPGPRPRRAARGRPSASRSRRAARRPSRQTSPTGPCSTTPWTDWPSRFAAGSPRAATRPDGDPEDPPAPLPHPHPVANNRTADP